MAFEKVSRNSPLGMVFYLLIRIGPLDGLEFIIIPTHIFITEGITHYRLAEEIKNGNESVHD